MGADGRDLRILAGAVGLSTLGDHAALTALVVLVHERTGSSLAVAALLLGLWGPVVALGGPAGALVDRVENARLIVLASAGQAAVVLAMAAVTTPAAALALAPLLGVGIAVVGPAEFALIPAAAGRMGAVAAGGRVETARYAGMALGPLAGGALAAAGDVRAALLLDAATFLVVAAAAGVMRARRAPRRAPGDARPRARDGVVALTGDRVLATTVGGALASLLVVSATIVALVAFAEDVLRVGGGGYGALVAVWTAGMVAGAVGVSARIPAPAHAAAALAAVVVQGLGVVAGAAAAVAWAAALGLLLGGVAQGVKNVLLRALIHERVAPAMHGRAYAAYNAGRNAAELAALWAGAVLVAGAGPRATLVVAGAGSAAIGLLALLALTGGVARVPSLWTDARRSDGVPEGAHRTTRTRPGLADMDRRTA